jgi:hypothetical protein
VVGAGKARWHPTDIGIALLFDELAEQAIPVVTPVYLDGSSP